MNKGAVLERPLVTSGETPLPLPVDVPVRYRDLLVEYRRSQLQLTSENLNRLAGVFDKAVAELKAKITVGDEAIKEAFRLDKGRAIQEKFLRDKGYYQSLMSNLEGVLQGLRSDFDGSLNLSMLDLAQNAAQREAEVSRLAGVEADGGLRANLTKVFTLSDQSQASVTFGRVALSAVERCAKRVFDDGFNLSDRLYGLHEAMRKTIGDVLVQGVTEQISASALALRIEKVLTEAGTDCSRYQAMRIARTEIVTAHREAHIASCVDPVTGNLKSFILGIGWRLSLSHPHSDYCDVWAGDDSGLGPGNYLPDDVPSDHPHGLCYTTTVLVDYPEVSAPSKAPNVDEVAESQAQYYADKNDDPAAKRWLAARAG